MRHRSGVSRCCSPWVIGALLVTASILPGTGNAAAMNMAKQYRIISYALSPNGKELAEVVRVAANGPGVEEISIRDISGDSSKMVYEGEGIGSIYWMNSRVIIFNKDGIKSKIEFETLNTLERGVLFRSSHPIYVAAYDRERGLLAYSYAVPWRWKDRDSVRITGGMTTLELISPRWARWPSADKVGAFRIFTTDSGFRTERIALSRTVFSMPPELVWRSGRLLGLVSSLNSMRTKIYDIESGRRLLSGVPIFRMMSFAASRGGRLAVVSNRLGRIHSVRSRCGCVGSLKVFELGKKADFRELAVLSSRRFIRAVGGIWFAHGNRIFVESLGFERPGGVNRWRLDEVNVNTDATIRVFRWPHGDLGGNARGCRFDRRRTLAVCIAQTLTEPPRLVAIDLQTGSMRTLGKMDSTQHTLRFSFKSVRVDSSFGSFSTGFLAVPPGSSGRRVPLAVMAYGFSESYSKYAQWITSYPVARLVRAGIAVMLVNWANIDDNGYGNFVRSKRAQQSALATFANAIPAARAAGVRVSKAMVMGWSFGGLFAADAIERLHEYVAAEVGDPADYNITEFGLGGSFWRLQSRLFFGSAPVGREIERYQYFDPSGAGKPAQGPILFEFVSRNPDAGQLLQEWKAAGTDVEAFAYRRSVHWLSVPAEAEISRTRNLYWAELNLLGPSSVSQARLHSVGLSIPTALINSRQDVGKHVGF